MFTEYIKELKKYKTQITYIVIDENTATNSSIGIVIYSKLGNFFIDFSDDGVLKSDEFLSDMFYIKKDNTKPHTLFNKMFKVLEQLLEFNDILNLLRKTPNDLILRTKINSLIDKIAKVNNDRISNNVRNEIRNFERLTGVKLL